MDIQAWETALYSVWNSTMGSFLTLLPNILGAIVVASVGLILGNWVKSLTIKSPNA
jgi:hypothetical protein